MADVGLDADDPAALIEEENREPNEEDEFDFLSILRVPTPLADEIDSMFSSFDQPPYHHENYNVLPHLGNDVDEAKMAFKNAMGKTGDGEMEFLHDRLRVNGKDYPLKLERLPHEMDFCNEDHKVGNIEFISRVVKEDGSVPDDVPKDARKAYRSAKTRGVFGGKKPEKNDEEVFLLSELRAAWEQWIPLAFERPYLLKYMFICKKLFSSLSSSMISNSRNNCQ